MPSFFSKTTSPTLQEERTINEDYTRTAEQELLNSFNRLSELSKGKILGMIQVLLEQQGEPADIKADGTQIKNSISINQNNGKVKINNK